MNIEVQKEDIKRIGNTIFCGEDGNLCIISDSDISPANGKIQQVEMPMSLQVPSHLVEAYRSHEFLGKPDFTK